MENKTTTETFFVQFRSDVSALLLRGTFAVQADAVAYGRSTGKEFDVSSRSGAIVWAWEMR